MQTASAASATDLEAGKGGSNGDVAKGGMGRDKSLRDIMSPGSKKKVRVRVRVGGGGVRARIKDGWAHRHGSHTPNDNNNDGSR